jgi:hypothetical protein
MVPRRTVYRFPLRLLPTTIPLALLLIREERQWEIGWSVRNEIA